MSDAKTGFLEVSGSSVKQGSALTTHYHYESNDF
jgi:hypothetical protein